MKFLTLILSLILSVNLIATPTASAQEEPIKIGILQGAEHASLDENRQGFIDELEEHGYKDGQNISINYQNAAGDRANIASMSQMLAGESDYIFAISTMAAQGLANLQPDCSIYISSVADPAGSGIVKSLEEPGANITGTTDMPPIKEQVQLLFSIYPEAKKVGIIYDSSEVNAQFQVDQATPLIEEAGAQVKIATITSTNDIQSVFGPLLEEVDAVLLVADNTISTAMSLVGDMAKSAGKGLVGGSVANIKENGLATYGVDYYLLGRQTARMLIDEIENGTKPADTPIQMAEDLLLEVNEDYAKAIGIDPKSIKLD